MLFVIIFLVIFAGVGLGGAWWYSRSAHAAGENSVEGKASASEKADDIGQHQMIRTGFRYAGENVWVHGNDVYTGMKFASITDEQMSMTDLRQQVEKAAMGLDSLASGEAADIAVFLTFRPIITEDWVAEVKQHAWDPTSMYTAYTEMVGGALDASGADRPEVYIIIKIATAGQRGMNAVARRLDMALTGVSDDNLEHDIVARWENDALNIQQRLAFMNAEPMTRSDLLWLITKPLHGHLTPGSNEFLPSRPWGANDFALAAAGHADNKKTHLVLHQVNENPYSYQHAMGDKVTSYTCFLAVSDWPEESVFNRNSAWIKFLARLDEPNRITMCYRMNVLPPREFSKIVKKQADDINNELTDIANHGTRAPDQNLVDFGERASALKADIDRQGIPGVLGQIFFQLSAESEVELEQLRERFTQTMRQQLDVKVMRPRRFQYRLMEMMMPGSKPQSLAMPYVRLQEPSVFAGGLPNTGTDVGDKPISDSSGNKLGWVGDYIGDTADGTPVHFSTHVALTKNKGAGIATVGASGGGKSTLALIKFFLESESGVRTIALDPKVDFAAFCYYMSFGPQVNEEGFDEEADAGILGTDKSRFEVINRRFWDDTLIVDVMQSEDGLLDCFQVSKNISDGETLAESTFATFLGKEDYSLCRLDLNNALAEVRHQYDERCDAATAAGKSPKTVPLPTMWQVVDEVIKARDEARESGLDAKSMRDLDTVVSILTRMRKASLSRLCFAQNAAGVEGIASGRKAPRRTVFTMRGMRLPKSADPEKWGPADRRAAGIMHIITKLASDMLAVSKERNPVTGHMELRPKLLFVDEAYMVSATEAGRAMLQTSLAQGRSYKFAVWIIDQLAGRLASIEDENADEAGGNQLPVVFAYSHNTPAEAKKALPLLGREGNEVTQLALQPIGNGGQMETGRAVMKDADSRVAIIAIDVPFVELLAATDTNPDSRPKRQSRPISPNVYEWTFPNAAETEQQLREATERMVSGEADALNDDGEVVEDVTANLEKGHEKDREGAA